MFKISISHTEINDLVREQVKTIALQVFERCQLLADQKLNTTKKIYTNSLKFVENESGYDIILEGDIANALENGWKRFDMKEYFQKSSKTKRSKSGGWYLVVPFRHKTIGPNKMPRSVYDAIRKEKRRLTEKKLPSKYSNPVANKQGRVSSSPRYAGLTKTPLGQKRSKYTTFRVVSSNSDSESWIHPGFDGVKILDEVLRDIII